MKYRLLFLVLTAAAALQAQTSSKQLLGSWQAQDDDRVVLTFQKNGKVEVMERGRSNVLNWSWDPTTKLLTLSEPGGSKSETFRTGEFSAEAMTFFHPDNDVLEEPMRLLRLQPTKSNPGAPKELYGVWATNPAEELPLRVQLNKDGSCELSEKGKVFKGFWLCDTAQKQLKIWSLGVPDTGLMDYAFEGKQLRLNRTDRPETVVLLNKGKDKPTAPNNTASDDAKPLPAKQNKKHIVGIWEFYDTFEGAIEPAVSMHIQANGKMDLNESDEVSSATWKLSANGQELLFREGSEGAQSWHISLYGKDLLLADIGGGVTMYWLRQGAKTPQKLPDRLRNASSVSSNNSYLDSPDKIPHSKHPHYKTIQGKWLLTTVGEDDVRQDQTVIELKGDHRMTVTTGGEWIQINYWKMDDEGTTLHTAGFGYNYVYFDVTLRIIQLSENALHLQDRDQVLILERQK